MSTKKCGRCQTVKPLSAFWKDVSRSDGVQWACKPCMYQSNRESSRRHPERVRATMARYRKRYPEKVQLKDREARLRREYGLTLESFDALLLEQGGGCAICSTDEPGGHGQWHVDHDHAAGDRAMRGILCSNCNLMLGHARDSVPILLAAVRYLELHSPLSQPR